MVDLKNIRKSVGLTQRELASILGIASCTLAHYESGLRKITLEMFFKIIDACNYKFYLINNNQKIKKK